MGLQASGWDRNGDGIATITDVFKVFGEAWVLATLVPFLVIEQSIISYMPSLGRFLEIDRIVPSMGVWSVLFGLPVWIAIAMAAVFLEKAVRQRLTRPTAR